CFSAARHPGRRPGVHFERLKVAENSQFESPISSCHPEGQRRISSQLPPQEGPVIGLSGGGCRCFDFFTDNY
ncbi:MAG: hypothetical protein WCZ16_03685, partial [Desulfosarcinaceae bacterium]